MKKTLLYLLLFCTMSYGAMLGTGKQQKPGTLILANYYITFSSDIITNSAGDEIIKNYDWKEETYVFKPVYYTDNFVFSATIPYRKMSRGFTDEKLTELMDIVLGVGYFIPNSFGDLLWMSRVQFPTAKYDPNKPKVYFGQVDAMQMGTNRYELQEELHFFKPVLDTKLPFIIDASLAYHHRFDDLDSGENNGYYFGAETTISAILTPNFFIGPAVYYKKYNKEESITPNTGSSKFQLGVGSLYKFDDKNSLAIEYVNDYKVKNRLKGDRWSVRYVYKFF